MSDLLGSILDNMKPPPSTIDKTTIRRRKEMKRKLEEENKKREKWVKDVEARVEKFVGSSDKELSFPPVAKEWRAIQHEVVEIAGLVSVSCYNGLSSEKFVTAFKKTSCPGEEELKKRRLGEKYVEGWNKARSSPVLTSLSGPRRQKKKPNFADNNKTSEHTNDIDTRQFFGLVPVHMLSSESDSIEDSLNEIRRKKKQKVEQEESQLAGSSSGDKAQDKI